MNTLKNHLILVLLGGGLTICIAATCTKATTGNVGHCVPNGIGGQICYTCPNCPTCGNSTTQTKCKEKCTIIGEICVPILAQCGPCNTYPGQSRYFDMPTYEDAPDSTCTPST